MKAKFDAARPKLYAAREKRIHPGRDEKILTDWNGLALRAFADAAAYLGRDDYRQIAESNAEFIFKTLWDGNRLLHSFKDGRARFNAYLDDYANVADGLISLYQLTFEEKWLKRAESLADHIIDKFWDAENGGFYFTDIGHEALITRTKDYFDNATPSGNSVAADVLVRLGALLGRNDLTEKAAQSLRFNRSVFLPNTRPVLAGSSKPSIFIWDRRRKSPSSLLAHQAHQATKGIRSSRPTGNDTCHAP